MFLLFVCYYYQKINKLSLLKLCRLIKFSRMQRISFALILAYLVMSPSIVLSATDEYFTAAVYEYVQLYDFCPENQQEADAIVQKNLEEFERAAKLAKEKDADVILFPEYGIFPECERETTRMFLEIAPDPHEKRVIPCNDPMYEKMTQLRTLSCIAKNNSMYLQANGGDIQVCQPTNVTKCPEDGYLQMNTNLIFDREGALIERYHKEHLWGEEGMDMAIEKQNPIFKTDFGTFASFVCFDVILARIIQVIEEPAVDGVFFSTMWENTAPLLQSVQFFQSWAMGNNVTLLAADINLAGQLALGSGIFHGQEGALAYTFDPDGISKLVVARVPRRGKKLTQPKASITAITNNGTYAWTDDGEDVPYITTKSSLFHLPDDLHTNRYHQADFVNYTLIKLTKPKDRLTACHSGFCCTLDYEMEHLNESFFFAVHNGTQGTLPPIYWCEEDCLIARCDTVNDKACSDFPLLTKDVFHHVSLYGNFSTPFVYPSVISSHMRLVPRREWDYQVINRSDTYYSFINFDSEKGEKILAAGLRGRCYDRDAPYSFF